MLPKKIVLLHVPQGAAKLHDEKVSVFAVTLVTLIAVQDILIIFKHFSSQDILIRDRTFSDFWKLWRKLFNSCRNTIRKGEKH